MSPRKKTAESTVRWYAGRVSLNWDGHRKVLRHQRDCKFCGTWDNTSHRRPPPDPCGRCGKTAHLLDETGAPYHKTCAEADMTERLPAPGEEDT